VLYESNKMLRHVLIVLQCRLLAQKVLQEERRRNVILDNYFIMTMEAVKRQNCLNI
jgi:hypothetical protein